MMVEWKRLGESDYGNGTSVGGADSRRQYHRPCVLWCATKRARGVHHRHRDPMIFGGKKRSSRASTDSGAKRYLGKSIDRGGKRYLKTIRYELAGNVVGGKSVTTHARSSLHHPLSPTSNQHHHLLLKQQLS